MKGRWDEGRISGLAWGSARGDRHGSWLSDRGKEMQNGEGRRQAVPEMKTLEEEQ